MRMDACRIKTQRCGVLFKCGNEQMTLAKVDFDAFTSMSEEERKDYANGWLYIHQKAKK